MYYAAESNIKSNVYRNRKLRRTDGIFPTTTMLLHERIVGWHRKKRIPVRDADKPNDLNAYLIDPKYLEKGEVTLPKELPEPQPTSSHPPVYQYSRITRNVQEPSIITASYIHQSAKHILETVNTTLIALWSGMAAQFRNVIRPKSHTQYAVNRGVLPWWGRRLKILSATVLTGGIIVAAASIEPSSTNKPTPVSANPSANNSQRLNAMDATRTASISSPVNASGSLPSTQSGASNAAAVSSTPSGPSSPQSPTASPTSLTGNTGANVVPTVIAPTTNSTTTPSPTPTQSTSPSQPLTPVLAPVTGAVNGVLSTQVTVNQPLTGTTTVKLN